MIRLIVAMTMDEVIGVNGDLPFRLSADLKHFKVITSKRVVVMGRKTYDSIGHPLPNRTNVVLSRTLAPIEGCIVVSSFQAVTKMFGTDFDVIGGAEIYALSLEEDLIDELIVTEIEDTVKEGVLTRFPTHLIRTFTAKEELLVQRKDESNHAAFVIKRYEKSNQ